MLFHHCSQTTQGRILRTLSQMHSFLDMRSHRSNSVLKVFKLPIEIFSLLGQIKIAAGKYFVVLHLKHVSFFHLGVLCNPLFDLSFNFSLFLVHPHDIIF